MKLYKLLIVLGLTQFCAFSGDKPKSTDLTSEEKVTFLKSSVVYLQTNLEVLQALLNNKLGIALQQQAQQSTESHNKLLETIRAKHNAAGCDVSLDGNWICQGTAPVTVTAK